MSGPGTFFGLEIARRGLMSHQKSLEVTGHNIANAGTPGYSRQEAVHKAGLPYPAPGLNSGTSPGQLGSGVEISEIRRIRNEYLDTQVRDSTSAHNFWDSRLEILEQIQSIFPEPDGRGIQEVLINFFSDWHDLNNTPQDAGIKSAVVESGMELARLFRDTYNQLQNVDKSIIDDIKPTAVPNIYTIHDGKIYDQVNRIDELVDRIKDTTESIIRVIREGRQPNDLLDKRDTLLDELAEYGPINVESVMDGNGKDTGGINVNIFGEVLIQTDPNLQVSRQGVSVTYGDLGDSDKLNDELILNIGAANVTLTDLTNNGTGSLVGIASAWQDNNKFIDDLNKLARELAEQVNNTYSPADPTVPADFFVGSGGNSFDPSTGVAGELYIQQDIRNNPHILDGRQALGIARLRNQTFSDLGDATLEGYYQGYIATIGAKTESAQNMQENQEAILEQIKNLRESTSGVSLDEELSRMIEFQYGYQASARVLSTLDDILDTMINRMAV